MLKCNQCVFYNKDGYSDMGFTIPECKLKLVEQLRLKNNNEKYDLFYAFIDVSYANNCKFFTSLSDAVDIIKDKKNL